MWPSQNIWFFSVGMKSMTFFLCLKKYAWIIISKRSVVGKRKEQKKLSKNLRDFYGNLSKQSCSATFQHLHMTYHHYVLRSACLRGATINFSQARQKKMERKDNWRFCLDKGQFVSKANLKVFIWTKNQTKIFFVFLP